MENNLLRKEEEFHKLNAELEIKTNELMKEVESVMRIQDRLSKSTAYCENSQKRCMAHSLSGEENPAVKKHPTAVQSRPGVGPHKGNLRARQAERNVDHEERLLQGVEVGDIVPVAANEMGDAALIRFLKAKLRLLQDALDNLQDEYKKLADKSRRTQMEVQQVADERDRWQAQVSSTKDLLSRQEQASANACKRLAERDGELAILKKEADALRKELKQASQTSSSNEIRLNRSLEEVDKLKASLKQAKMQEKELRDSSRRKDEEQAASVRRLEKQKSELVAAFKRQLQLVDNLKKQKAHLEANLVLQFTEEDFVKLLGWNPAAQQRVNGCRALE